MLFEILSMSIFKILSLDYRIRFNIKSIPEMTALEAIGSKIRYLLDKTHTGFFMLKRKAYRAVPYAVVVCEVANSSEYQKEMNPVRPSSLVFE